METNLVELGNRIKTARKAKKLNQQQLGELLGKSIRTIQMYEKGETDISLSLINEIAKNLEVSPASLLGYEAPEIKLDSLSDVLSFVFSLKGCQALRFNIDVKKPPHSDSWECSLVFNGKDPAKYNADLCLALESFQDDLDDNLSSEQMKERQEKTLAYYMNCKLDEE